MKKNKLSKYMEYAKSLIRKAMHEKKYRANGVNVKYILEEEENSKALVVVFSACTRPGIPARYNYMRTLEGVKCNKLFVLDDLAQDKRGIYYLGSYPDYDFEKATKKLIDSIIEKNKIEKCYFCGSSKGGWAALNFGVMYNSSIGDGIIIGAPQYHLGNYLNAPANHVTLESIAGDNPIEKVIYDLNGHLKENIIKNSQNKLQPVYLHYSEKEHTYQEHIKDMISLLEDQGYKMHCDVLDYEDHWDVSIHYPEFLLKSLSSYEF